MIEFIDEGIFEEDDIQGRFLTFTVRDNIYGMSIRFVTEIIPMQKPTMVPETPDYVKGIINLRGRIIPLIDMRLKFAKEEIPYTPRTCIIIIDVDSIVLGLIVEKVNDVLKLNDNQISAPPPGGTLGYENRYIEGIAKIENAVLLLLNAEKLLKTEEMDMIGNMVDGNE